MTKLIAGNWKSNPATLAEAEGLIANYQLPRLRRGFGGQATANSVEVVLLPPFEFLEELMKKFPQFKWGMQDFVSSEIKVDYVLVGHSDRRRRGETDEEVNKKFLAALGAGFKVILAVGEMQKGNESGVMDSLKASTTGVPTDALDRLNVAYEPVWAISTTPGAEVDTPEHASSVISELQKILNVRYLYGGSVDGSNIGGFFAQPNIKGALVGAASLKPSEFRKIIEAAE
ncbi:MAG: triosephosphate isomerase [Candidatus Brennerbacteria bacterium]|nr:triosephosphate isomerase [Candidatus Brennerbacteria bacterium]